MPKIIPKSIFQALSLSLLLMGVLLTGYWFVTDAGLYHFFVELFGRSLLNRATSLCLALLANLFGVLVFVIMLRPFVRDMPSLKTQLQKDVDLLKAPGSLAEKLAQARAEGLADLRQTSPQMLG